MSPDRQKLYAAANEVSDVAIAARYRCFRDDLATTRELLVELKARTNDMLVAVEESLEHNHG